MRTLQTVFLNTCNLRLCESRSAGVSHTGGLCGFPLSSARLGGTFRTEEGSTVGDSPFPLCDSGHLAAHPGGCPVPPPLTLASVWVIPARLPGTCLGIRISENCSIVFVGLQASTVGEVCCPPSVSGEHGAGHGQGSQGSQVAGPAPASPTAAWGHLTSQICRPDGIRWHLAGVFIFMSD